MTAPVMCRLFGTAEAAHVARDFARQVLAGNSCQDTADLIVTELFANAVAYTRSGLPGGWVEVSITSQPGGVLIEVRDQGAVHRPEPGRDPDEHGRGLAIVDAFAEQWGSRPEGRGRTTWCYLAAGATYIAFDAHRAHGAYDARVC